MLKLKYLFRISFYRNCILFGPKFAIWIAAMGDEFDDLIKLIDANMARDLPKK